MKISISDLKIFSINFAHEVFTVGDMQLSGIKNGILLALLKENGFDCWIVVDKNITNQQNISKPPCSVILLDVFRNTLNHIARLLPDLLVSINDISENKITIISEPKNK